jgi:(p)ppGpp synthase/HD superfamily hydrolase
MDESDKKLEIFKKAKISLRYWLIGRGYFRAVKAMEYALTYHKGVRKDGLTPEFYHQLSMAHYARVFEPLLIYKEETYGTIFLHDIPEDYYVSFEELKSLFEEMMANASMQLNKMDGDRKMSNTEYFRFMHRDPIVSVCKGVDRINNFQTMVNVFSTSSQLAYITETEHFILPMLKKAKRLFPEQEAIYENMKVMLLNQLEFVNIIHKERDVKPKDKK